MAILEKATDDRVFLLFLWIDLNSFIFLFSPFSMRSFDLLDFYLGVNVDLSGTNEPADDLRLLNRFTLFYRSPILLAYFL